MSISETIARVRKGAKSTRIEGVLASVGASVSASLQSSSIPERLRPAATRIASLLGAPHKGEHHKVESPVSLERSLAEARGVGSAASPHGTGSPASSPTAEVCPFTGLDAAGMPGPSAQVGSTSSTGSEEDSASGAVASDAADAPSATAAVAAQVAPVGAIDSEVTSGAPKKRGPAEGKHAPASAAKKTVVGAPGKSKSQPPKGPAKEKAAAGEAAGRAAGEKRKEKLARGGGVAKTPARSATKPAAKQTNGGANQRKKS